MHELKNLHSIITITENCTGCTRCLRMCPTEALRVRNDIIHLDENRCIDCGQCVVTCPFGAVHTNADRLSIIENFTHRIAIIPSSFAGQFASPLNYSQAIKGLKAIGFDEVYEESMLTPSMNRHIRQYLKSNPEIRPIFSSNSPAVLKLIQARFPSLLSHILYLEAPVSTLARHARKKAEKSTGLPGERIGVFLIASCLSQITAVHHSEGTYTESFDGALAMSEVYCEIMKYKKEIIQEDYPEQTHNSGLNWATVDLEADAVNDGSLRTLAVSGINNVISILTTIENHQIDYFDYIVLHNCIQGEVGGILNSANPFIATSRIKEALKKQDLTQESDVEDSIKPEIIAPLNPRPIMQLDTDIKKSLQKIKQIKEIHDKLPGLDCSACGSPNCYALAEDIVDGKAHISDCVVLMKHSMEK